jgi:hypothetical protein
MLCSIRRKFLHNGGKEAYVQNKGHALRHLLVLPGPAIKVHGKLKQANSDRTNDGTDNTGIKIWFTLPGQELLLADILAEGQRNME